MKVCVISNSHAASLKDGWTSLCKSMPDTEVTFFAAPNKLMVDVIVNSEEKKLYTEDSKIKQILSFTSGGLEVIDVMNYDAFLVYGLFLSIPRLERRHSSAVKEASVLDTVIESINYRIVSDLCNVTSAPVFYSPNPLLSESILDDAGKITSSYHEHGEISDWIEAHYSYPNAVQVKQNIQTMGPALTTQKRFSKGSVRLTRQPTEHVVHDVMHMNAEYGEGFMQMFLQQELAKQINTIQKVA